MLPIAKSSPSVLQASALILVAEDEPDIADILEAYLARNGFRSVRAADGRRALDLHATLKPDLVLLDIQIPYVDGWQVLSEIRHRGQTPVIMLTALDQGLDKLMGLRIGADDYITKPFNPDEVVARIQAVLRRSHPHDGSSDRHVWRVGALQINMENHEVLIDTGSIHHRPILTLTEFNLLAHMARAPRRVFRRTELLAACLPEGDALERTVDSHISKLRKKLEDLGVTGVPESIRGIGYKFGGDS